MKAFVITLPEQWETESHQAAQRCIDSIESTGTALEAKVFDATTPPTIAQGMVEAFGRQVKWSWPVDASQDGYDLATGLYKRHYPAVDHLRVVSCAVSHARLWKKCVELDEPITVLEHDTVFIKQFHPEILNGWNWGAVGLNDPRGATRKAGVFHRTLQAKYDREGPALHKVPRVDQEGELPLPMGLAGNSAYVIKPYAAKELLEVATEIGLWPNDALMCSQLFRWLRVTTPYYTKVQGIRSTTTAIGYDKIIC